MTITDSPAKAITTPDQHRILRLYGQGHSITAIVKMTDLELDTVSAAVAELAGIDRGRARELVLAYERNARTTAKPIVVATPKEAPTVVPAAAPAPKPATATVRVVAPVAADLPIIPTDLGDAGPAELLDYAEQSGDRRLRQLAARARALHGDIRTRLSTLAEQQAVERRVVELVAELARARAALRAQRAGGAVRGTPEHPAPTPLDLAEHRAWAAANGVKCSTTGRVPQAAIDAYEAAQRAGAA